MAKYPSRWKSFALALLVHVQSLAFACSIPDRDELNKIKSQAVLGNAVASAWIGTQFLHPTNSCMEVNLNDASRWLGNAESQIETVQIKNRPSFHYMLGVAFDEIPDEQNSAISQFNLALDSGYSDARIGLAKSYTKTKSWKAAAYWWNEIATKHRGKQQAEGYYRLGLIRYGGLDDGIAKIDEAKLLLQKAKNAGEVRANSFLADLENSIHLKPYIISSFNSEDLGKLKKEYLVNCGKGANVPIIFYYDEMKYWSPKNGFGSSARSESLKDAIKLECE